MPCFLRRILPLLLIIACLLSGCNQVHEYPKATDNSSGANPIRNLTIAMSKDPGTADAQLTAEEYFLPLNLFDRLVEVKATAPGKTEIVPGLAATWDISADGLTYTFYLRREVTFHNGAPFTAEDVIFTFDRMLNPATKALNTDFLDMILGAEERLAGIATYTSGLKALDAYTVEITLAHPFTPFLPGLATPACSIYSWQVTEELGERFGAKPVGTGPFMLSEWHFDSRIVLSAFADYYQGAPQLDSLTALILPDAETGRMLFEAGVLDIYDLDLNRFQIPYFRQHPQYAEQIVSGTRVGTYFLVLNQQVAPLDNIKLREAVAWAIDRELLLERFFYATGVPAKGVLAPGLTGYNPDLPGFKYDLAKAKNLLGESGVSEPSLVIWQANNSPNSLYINEVLQGMLSQAGFKVKIEQVDAGVWHATRREGNRMMAYYTNWSADFNDPDNFMYTLFAEDNSRTRSFNVQNPHIADLLQQGRSLASEAERFAAYHEVERVVVYEEFAFIPLFHLDHLFVVNPRVSGFEVSWNGWSDMNYYRVEVR